MGVVAVSPKERERVEFTRCWAQRGESQWFHRVRRRGSDSRGIAFLTSLFIVFSIEMMLFAFVFIMRSEVGFAALNLKSAAALSLADAGIQESTKRLSMFGALPGASFTNSLASSVGSSGTVTYQVALQNNPAVFPILSQVTYGGAQRVIRVFERRVFKTGFGNVIYGPQITFQGNAQPVAGDQYSQSNVAFAQYQKSPLCASGATGTNLVAPQVIAGTTIGAGAGPNQTPPCGSPVNAGTYTTECASGSLTEVAPTPCGRAMSGAYPAPVNWHPMTPIGMSSTDFTAVVTATVLPSGVAVPPATQNGIGVTYSPTEMYVPSYWTSVPTTNGKVMLVTATQPFCVNATLPPNQSVTVPIPAITGVCPAGAHYYGNQVSGTPNTTRYLDWGLVTDDLSRNTAATFFQPPTCATCNNGSPNGKQNGIRYIPLLPTVNVLGQACVQNINPGTNVFDQVNTADGITCPNPPVQTIASTSVTFSGTKSSPESLVIDNAGIGTVQIFGSVPGGGVGCNANFDNYNWGVILATGDLDLQGNLVFTGFIYTPGSIISHGTVVVQGGIYGANVQGSSSQVNQVDSLGTVNFCTATSASLVLSPQFFTFTTLSWQDRPLSVP